MNWNIVEGNFKQLKAKIAEQLSRLPARQPDNPSATSSCETTVSSTDIEEIDCVSHDDLANIADRRKPSRSGSSTGKHRL